MQKRRYRAWCVSLILAPLGQLASATVVDDEPPAVAPDHHHMEGMSMTGQTPAPADPDVMAQMQMPAMLGPYTMSREASGTSWQPDSTPMTGLQQMAAPWTTMWDGHANLIYDHQGGPRGGDKSFSTSMLMGMGRRELAQGALGLRVMVSADPLMGRNGYPELFQTGETADGVHPLIDRQHPHNLLMEAAASYSRNLSEYNAVFAYAGVAGEPALGPPAFMHRLSAMDNPVAPLGHHWLDATHISYGVVTAGSTWDRVRIEASLFNGREPDQNRYQVDMRHLDSQAVRVAWNPRADLALQASTGRLASPEQLQPDVAVRRTTVSASYNRMGRGLESQTTLAWGRNEPLPGNASDAWLLESEVVADMRDTVFGRIERVGKDELFAPGQSLYGRTFAIDSLSLGYIHDVARIASVRVGIGGMATVYRYDRTLDASYGSGPVSFLVFLRARL